MYFRMKVGRPAGVSTRGLPGDYATESPSRWFAGIAHGNKNTDWRVMVRLYRGPLLLVIFLFLMGINVYCWRSSGVNHVLIFELDPRNHLTEQHIMELATVFGLVWAGSALIFLYSEALHIPPYINPLILAVLMIAFLFNPTKTLRHDARFWVLRVAVSDFGERVRTRNLNTRKNLVRT